MNKSIPPKPLSEEQKREQAIRMFAQKRESYAVAFLSALMRNGNLDENPEKVAKYAIEVTDAFLKEFYQFKDATESEEKTATS